MTIQQYFHKINSRFQSGISTEHSYRGDLQLLLESLCPNIDITNEPVRISCGAPDYILTKKGEANFPVGYIEAKDLSENINLDTIEESEQLIRYRRSLGNLILTNYIEFRFFQEGKKVIQITIAKIEGKKLVPFVENWPAYESLIKDFSSFTGVSIKSASKLAELMASKAILMQQVLQAAIESDVHSYENSSLKDQMEAIKNVLIHDIKPFEFADIYAQTIAYGMFAARLHDETLGTFSRQEASELIPKSNPFLKKLFGYIAGVDVDERIIWIIDALAEIFRATDVAAILKDFGRTTRMQDPIIHFYETFLAAYNPKLRKSRGVWYTPQPVVSFIVKAVDDVLQKEFQLPMGLADSTKVSLKRKYVSKATADQRSKIKEVEVTETTHRVQILDPATGTGTFLGEVVKQVHSKFEGQDGIWSKYVEDNLIPRLNGFELLMASYAMAHLKLDLLLKQTNYSPTKKEGRLRIYLTNSLEEAHPDTSTLWATFLSQEASEANHIKRDTPVMVVIGNPPYNKSSSNTGTWINNLVKEYKRSLDETSINSLSDDYVKFIRYAQYYIERNGQGIIAMITNNSFIDGITHRVMRKSLLEVFNKIYVLDLHGSAIRKERTKDGKKDENVFDIRQGVSISIFIKNADIGKEINYFDILGLRDSKYEFLANNNISSIPWQKVPIEAPYYFFSPFNFKDNILKEEESFSVNELFVKSGNGIKFRKDELLIKKLFTIDDAKQMVDDVLNLNADTVLIKYAVSETEDWKLEDKRKYFKNSKDEDFIKVDYRQFDARYTYYPLDKINQIIVRGDSRRELMKNYLVSNDLGLIIGRQGQVVGDIPWNLVFITEAPTDMNIFYRGGGINFPLYINKKDELRLEIHRQPNFREVVLQKIVRNIEGTFVVPEDPFSVGKGKTITPTDIFNYIYGLLHSPEYRRKYNDFLKVNFPRIPYPSSLDAFRLLCSFGEELKQLHLLKHPVLTKLKTKYVVSGDNIIRKVSYNNDKVFINETQYFEGVSSSVWNFYIGGYQPAQKWLKDRKEKALTFEETILYQKIIVSIDETIRIMQQIQKSQES